MNKPIWLQKNAVIAFHEMTLAEHGGLMGIRDEGLLDSALSRPVNRYIYEPPSLYRLAASYAYGIASNHPFLDGNKRTAFISMKTFLYRNGLWLDSPKEESIEQFIDLAAGLVKETKLAEWIEKYCLTKT